MKQINKWKVLTDEITEMWIREYFEIGEDEEVSYDWVCDDIGTVFCFADYWFNFSDVLDCYKHKITKEQLFDWYYYILTEPYINISLAKYILSSEEKDKKEKESLERSIKNLEMAQEEFNKAMEKYGV